VGEGDIMKKEDMIKERYENIKKCLEEGKSLYYIHKTYGYSLSTITKYTKKYGLIRTNNYNFTKHGEEKYEWRKLNRIGKAKGRVLFIPSIFLKRLGFDLSKELECKIMIEEQKNNDNDKEKKLVIYVRDRK
jgi:hypothetical protein